MFFRYFSLGLNILRMVSAYFFRLSLSLRAVWGHPGAEAAAAGRDVILRGGEITLPAHRRRAGCPGRTDRGHGEQLSVLPPRQEVLSGYPAAEQAFPHILTTVFCIRLASLPADRRPSTG